jgi:hypothetical protein
VWAFVGDDGEVLVHRCTGRRGRFYRFQGDAAARPDPDVTSERLVGSVVATEVGGQRRPVRARWTSYLWWALRRLQRRALRRIHR